jgi:hypothetical protein
MFAPDTTPADGLGDDEELAIGGRVAGMRQGPVTETQTTTQVTNTMKQDVFTVGPSVAITDYGQCVPVAGYTMVQTTWQQSITTHTFTRIDPGNYRGNFDAAGRRTGPGTCTWVDGSTYEGEWKNGVRHGKGVFKSREGTVYDGMFMDDIRHGAGKLTYASGNQVIGTWDKDRLDGPGELRNKGKRPIPVVF